jgi:hypothetical protein
MHSRRLISLGLIGCAVDYAGLLALGNITTCVCHRSLRDLHLSESLSDRRVFYAIPLSNSCSVSSVPLLLPSPQIFSAPSYVPLHQPYVLRSISTSGHLSPPSTTSSRNVSAKKHYGKKLKKHDPIAFPGCISARSADSCSEGDDSPYVKEWRTPPKRHLVSSDASTNLNLSCLI